MPSASSYTNKLRALTDARNVKVQYPGNIVNTYRPGLSLTCDANMVPSVVTIAGTRGSPGSSGDNGPATQARLNSPHDVCTNSIGDIFIADRGNARVRKIDASGKITTFITVTPYGTGANFGITIDGNDILYVTDPNYRGGPDSNTDGRIVCVNSKTGVTVRTIWPNNRSVLFEPNSVWVTNADVYIGNPRAGQNNIGTVSRYSLTTGGTTVYNQFYFPLTVAVGPDGSIYSIENPDQRHPNRPPSSKESHCVKRYKNGVYSIFAGISQTPGDSGDGGPATLAKLNNPSSVFVDAVGNVYICDTGNSRIRMVTPDGIIQTVVGGGASYNEGGAPLEIQTSPANMWFDAQGHMYFTDQTQHVVRRINSVYRPSWWDPFQYQKICKPCNAFVRLPPLPPVPTLLSLSLTDSGGGQGLYTNDVGQPIGVIIPVSPSNALVYMYIDAIPSGASYSQAQYVTIRLPKFNGVTVGIDKAYIGDVVLVQEIPPSIPLDISLFVGNLLSSYNTETNRIPIIVTFTSPINSIDRIYYTEELPGTGEE